MNIELTEEQNELLKDLKLLDPELPFKGIPDSHIISEEP